MIFIILIIVIVSIFRHKKLNLSLFLPLALGVGSYHTKIILLSWFILVQVLLSSFTASLSSILVNEKLDPDDDNMKVGYNGQSFVHGYLQSNFNYKPENLVNVGSRDEYALAFENKTINAAYLELSYLRVFLSTHKDYVIHGESRTLEGFGFVSPLVCLIFSVTITFPIQKSDGHVGSKDTLMFSGYPRHWF